MGNTQAAYERGRRDACENLRTDAELEKKLAVAHGETSHEKDLAEARGEAAYERGRAEARAEIVDRLFQIIKDLISKGYTRSEILQFFRQNPDAGVEKNGKKVNIQDDDVKAAFLKITGRK